MPHVEDRLRTLGLVLPPPTRPPPGVVLPFQFVRLVGTRALISGHGPQNADGSFAEPRGKVGRDLTVEQGYHAARLTALSMLGSLAGGAGELVIVVRDPGPGFDIAAVPDPLEDANLSKPSGRGVFLINHMMDSVVFSDGGRQVMMRKSVRGHEER